MTGCNNGDRNQGSEVQAQRCSDSTMVALPLEMRNEDKGDDSDG